jgi:hypothetical protein
MTELQKTMLTAKLNPPLLRMQAQQIVSQAKDDMKPEHRFVLAYMILAVKRLYPDSKDAFLTTLQNFEAVTLGFGPQEKLSAFEYCVYAKGTGFNKNPWLAQGATLAHIQTLPHTLRWRGETNPKAELVVWRGVAARNETEAQERHLRLLWSNSKEVALTCCGAWLLDYPGNTPVLAKAKIKHKDIVAILNPSKDERHLEIVLDCNGLYDLQIFFPTLEEILASVQEPPPPRQKTSRIQRLIQLAKIFRRKIFVENC